MKCPGCGYVSFDLLETCGQCGAAMTPRLSAPAAAALPPASPAPAGADPDGGLAALRLDPEIEQPAPPRRRAATPRRRAGRSKVPAEPAAPGGALILPAEEAPPVTESLEINEDDLAAAVRPPHRERRPPQVPEFHLDEGQLPPLREPDAPRPPGFPEFPALFRLETEPVQGTPMSGGPIIDHDDEVPERFWAPGGASLGRRAAAQLIDQLLLLATLGLFFAGAFLALWKEGFDTAFLLAPSGLLAALPPFALLGALVSLVFTVGFHVVDGSTPGKRVAGIEVRCRDGSPLTWGRAALRWGAGVLGLACGGVGIAWALFEPRRRGWADLLSNTVVTERLPPPPDGAPAALTTPEAAGTMPPL